MKTKLSQIELIKYPIDGRTSVNVTEFNINESISFDK